MYLWGNGRNIGRASYTSERVKNGRPCNIKIETVLRSKVSQSLTYSSAYPSGKGQATSEKEGIGAASDDFNSFHWSNSVGMPRPGMLCGAAFCYCGDRTERAARHMLEPSRLRGVVISFPTFQPPARSGRFHLPAGDSKPPQPLTTAYRLRRAT